MTVIKVQSLDYDELNVTMCRDCYDMSTFLEEDIEDGLINVSIHYVIGDCVICNGDTAPENVN